jgi:uncharacterized protein YbjT (DUF2867 family)
MTLGITGASGNLGRLATEALLERVDPGDVVLFSRDPSIERLRFKWPRFKNALTLPA